MLGSFQGLANTGPFFIDVSDLPINRNSFIKAHLQSQGFTVNVATRHVVLFCIGYNQPNIGLKSEAILILLRFELGVHRAQIHRVCDNVEVAGGRTLARSSGISLITSLFGRWFGHRKRGTLQASDGRGGTWCAYDDIVVEGYLKVVLSFGGIVNGVSGLLIGGAFDLRDKRLTGTLTNGSEGGTSATGVGGR